jgi:molybdopterin-binding protein
MSLSGINTENHIEGIVRHIQLGDVISEVELDTPAGVVTSVLATRSLRRLGLQVGQTALAVVKATEVALAKAG